jgi:hypothetical protein
MLLKDKNATLVNTSKLFRFEGVGCAPERRPFGSKCFARQYQGIQGSSSINTVSEYGKDPESYIQLRKAKTIDLHSMFNEVGGDVEDWEVIYDDKAMDVR